MAQLSSDSLSAALDSSPADDQQSQSSSSDPSPQLSRNLSSSRLNAKAPEFVPRSSSSTDPTQQTQLLYHQPPPPPPLTPGSGYFHAPAIQGHVRVPVQNHRAYAHHVPVQYHQQHHHQLVQAQKQGAIDSDHVPKNGLTEEATQKILNQA